MCLVSYDKLTMFFPAVATGHVGRTLLEGLITLITMAIAFTCLGSLGMVLNSFHVFFNAP